MFGSLLGSKGAYNSDIENEESENESHHNTSMASPIGRGVFFARRESKIQRETKLQRAASLIKDINYEEVEQTTRYKPEYKHAKYVIFPDDTCKIL